MKKKKVILITLSVILALSLAAYGKEFNLALSGVKLHYTQHNPIKISIEDAKNGSGSLFLESETYVNSNNIKGKGEFELDKTSLVSSTEMEASVKKGSVSSTLRSKDTNTVVFASCDGNCTVESSAEVDGEYSDKFVKVRIATTQADRGILRTNHNNPEFGLPDEEYISKQFGVSSAEARNLLDEHGKVKLINAFEGMNKFSSNSNRGNNPAGGAGAIAGNNGVIGINNLSSSAVFNLYLKGIKYEGYVRHNSVFMRVYYPDNGVNLNNIPINLTLHGPVNSDRYASNIALMGTLKYSSEKRLYKYAFQNGDWLVDLDRLPSGHYELHLDVERIQHIELPVTLTEDKKIVPGHR